MRNMDEVMRALFLPVRRRIMTISVFWLCGILLADEFYIWPALSGVFCALLLAWAALRLSQRKSVLFCIAACMFLAGNMAAGHMLSVRDLPTNPGVSISGVVSAIERPNRVYLSDTEINGEAVLSRNVLVTLMLDEGEMRDEVRVGQRVSGTGRLFAPEESRNPGGINRRITALNDGYELSGYILPGWTAEGTECFSLREGFRRAGDWLLLRIGQLFGERAPLFQGVMLGDRSAMDKDLVASMRMTGTVHIITVSGLHLMMIASVLRRLISLLPVGAWSAFILQTAALSAFAGLTGCAAGTIRALLMAVIRELAQIRGRRYEPLTALSLSALLMTLYRPLWALDASFRFSFFVVLGIQLLSMTIRAAAKRIMPSVNLPRMLSGLSDSVSVSMGAQLAALPMQLMLYGYLPLLSLPMNLFCGMLIPALLLGGWMAVIISFVSFAPARMLAGLLGRICAVFESISLFAASYEGGIVRLPAPYGVSVLIFAALLMLLSSRIKWGKARKAAAAVMALLLLVTYLPRLDPSTRYVQLDVGQGDGALFRRGRHAVLIDAGPADSYDMLHYLRHEGLMIEAVFLSHLDEDHAGALAVLAGSEIAVPAIVMPKHAVSAETTETVLLAIGALAEGGTKIYEVDCGDSVSVLGMEFDVLAPLETYAGSNERSLLLFTELEGVSFLLAGDLPAECEPAAVPDCTVLKVAHHGSRYATSDRFLAMAKPEISVISVGKGNAYGHPTGRVLDSLRAVGSRYLRTDESGCITLHLRRGEIWPEVFLKSAK